MSEIGFHSLVLKNFCVKIKTKPRELLLQAFPPKERRF